MLQSTYLRNPVLINSIGHTAGVLLFGLVVFLLLRDWRAEGRLSLTAAALAFTWNAGSLLALGLPKQDSLMTAVITTLNFSTLSLLPAVLLHVALQGRHRWIVVTGYAVSACAILLHLGELFSPDVGLHQPALVVIALGFGFLAVISFFRLRKRDHLAGASEWISLICLLLFTTSFLHFNPQHVSAPWASEVTWHHIGIPLALIVLLQDYRFLLLDTFARFLVNFGLASLYIASLLVVNQRFRLWEAIQHGTFLAGIYLVLLCVSLILFAYFRNASQGWMSRVIFRRQSTDNCRKVIAELATAERSEEDLLRRASQEVARHLGARHFAVRAGPVEPNGMERPSVLFRGERPGDSERESFSAEAQLPVRFSSGDSRYLIFGPRLGGRRYLSEDLEDMRLLGSAIVEQVERFRAEELKRLVSQAELRALQAQINPHFLFNALNTLYGTIDRGSYIARRTVLNLADIFRYVLQSDRAVIQLSEEVKIVQAYLEIEALRLGERLQTELVIDESARSAMIPILSIQPLIENAVKHGISGKSGGGRVSLKAEKSFGGLRVTVEDTGVGFEGSSGNQDGKTSVGIENVRRRLLLCHGPEADLHIQSSSSGTKVTFFLPQALQAEHVVAQPAVEI